MEGTKAAASNINVMNAMRAKMSLMYQDRIPIATQENIASLYESILNVPGIRNEFVDSLVNLVLMQSVESAYFHNPLTELKSAPMRYGYGEEEIYVNMAKGHEFDMWAGPDKLFGYYAANVMSAMHKINHDEQYAVTISFDDLRTAFMDAFGIRTLINAKTESLVSGEQYDEYLLMLELVNSAYASGQLFPVTIQDPVDEASSRALVKTLMTFSDKMRFPTPAFNIAGADSSASKTSIFALVTPEVSATLTVDVLAYMFNVPQESISLRKIVIDKFRNPAVKMFLFDARWFNVRDQLKTFTSNNGNGAALSWNYFYTVQQMFSYSPFFPAIVFTTENFSVTGITVNDVTDARPGTIVEVTALATAAAGQNAMQYMTYAISGQTSDRTHVIPGTNQVSIGKDEKATSITVTATSRYAGFYGKDVSGTGTITLSARQPYQNIS